jgi:hypothetical protein
MKIAMYKGSGWFKDNYRHYLAAKGIKTRYDYLAHKEGYFISKEERLKRKAMGLSNRGPRNTPSGTPGAYTRTRPRKIISFEELLGKLAVAPIKRKELEDKARANGYTRQEDIDRVVNAEMKKRNELLYAARDIESRVADIDEDVNKLEEEVANIKMTDAEGTGVLKTLFGARGENNKRITIASLKKAAKDLEEIETPAAQEASRLILKNVARIEEHTKKAIKLQKERAELVKQGEKLAGIPARAGVDIGHTDTLQLLTKEEIGTASIRKHPESGIKISIVTPGVIEKKVLWKYGLTHDQLKAMGSDATLKSIDPSERIREKTMMLNQKTKILKEIERVKQRVAARRRSAIVAHAPPLSGVKVSDIRKEAEEKEAKGEKLLIRFLEKGKTKGSDLPSSVLKGLEGLSGRSRGKRLVTSGRDELIKRGQKIAEKEMNLMRQRSSMKASAEQRSGVISTELQKTGISTQKETGKGDGFVLVEPRVHQKAPQNIFKTKVTSKERVKREERRQESARRATPEYVEKQKRHRKMLAKDRSEKKSAEREEAEINESLRSHAEAPNPSSEKVEGPK